MAARRVSLLPVHQSTPAVRQRQFVHQLGNLESLKGEIGNFRSSGNGGKTCGLGVELKQLVNHALSVVGCVLNSLDP